MNKYITLIILIIALLTGAFTFIWYKQKPLERDIKIKDTDIHIETSYNVKYKIIRLNIVLDEVIEEWQINSIGEITNIKLECETQDKTVKKEYEFNEVKLAKGKKPDASIILENSSLTDYLMVKDLLKGDIKIESSKYISLDTKERDELQKEYYNKQKIKEEESKPQPKAQPRRAKGDSFFDTLFDF